MRKIPITLEQYECIACKKKWYINTEDKVNNEMMCPYGCECKGNITRRFDMMIHNYEDYDEDHVQEEEDKLNENGGG